MKSIFKGIIHIIIVLILLCLMNIGLYYFFGFIFLKIFFPVNAIPFIYKILVFPIGGGICYVLFGFIQRTISILGGSIFEKFNGTESSQLIVYIITFANAIYNIIWICKIPETYNFWIVCELIMMSYFILKLNYIVLPASEQIELYRNKDNT